MKLYNVLNSCDKTVVAFPQTVGDTYIDNDIEEGLNLPEMTLRTKYGFQYRDTTD